MRTLPSFLLVLALSSPGAAQTASSGVAGHWEGVIRAGEGPALVSVQLDRGESGWSAAFSAPAYGVAGLRFPEVAVSGDSVRLAMPGMLEMRGRVGPEGSTLAGTATAQGRPSPFVLARAGSAEALALRHEAGAARESPAARGIMREFPDLPDLHAAVLRDSAVQERLLGGCVRVHHLWKRQIAALHHTVGEPAERRVEAAVRDVYRPWPAFWDGYLRDEAAFAAWMSTRFDLAADPRARIPLEVNLAGMIAETTERANALTGRTACGDWYIVYGPGWTNMGSAGAGMIVDLLGMPREGLLHDLRAYLPHEVAHLAIGAGHRGDPANGTLLARIIEEGLATWFAEFYHGGTVSAAQAHSYTEAEWRWALANERSLWAAAQPLLSARDRETLDRFAMARSRVLPGAPGKAGYFLGYRIVSSYVSRHGEGSWRTLFALPYGQVLRESGYGAVRVRK